MAAGTDLRDDEAPRPRIEVVVAVHTATRPIARAVASALRNRGDVRVTVVAHNVDVEVIRANLAGLAGDPRVRLLELHDGIPSPAGPMNIGFASATGEYVALLGSDDEFEAGALDAWSDLARRDDADVVIAPIRDLGRLPDPYPPVRIGRAHRLDADRDRLSYRSAPLGLVSRRRFGDLRFAEGLHSGEDLPFVTRLWFSGARISFDANLPVYLGHVDEPDRVTHAPRPLADDFRFLSVIQKDPAFERMTAAQRRALVVKIFRIHVFDAIAARLTPEGLDEETRTALKKVIKRLKQWSRDATAFLALSDRRALDVALRPDSSGDAIRERLAARWAYGRPSTMIAANPLLTLHRHGPFRTLFAGAVVQRTLSAAIARRARRRSPAEG